MKHNLKTSNLSKSLPALVAFIIFTALLEVLVKSGGIQETLIPAPSQVLKTIAELHPDFQTAFIETLKNTLCGLALSILIGGLTAFVFSMSNLLKRAILPFAVFFQTVPIIAIAPLLVIYFGFGAPTVIASSFIVSIFPIIASTLSGLESASSAQKDLFKIYHASPWQTLVKLKLPNAYSHILSGLKIAIGLSIIGSIAGEFVAGGGLGAMIDAARTQQRVDIVFASLLLLSILGLLLIGALNITHRIVTSRRPFSQGEI
ncbi:ABC transporter permease [Bdellovibrio svalbardensis]|uniref:ABC transporter permease n=1 Tax=Bdellovibrio svalbardensis TaxID=2972972 RepID=A0ABT6DK67_9BACT|nr:ABC transporter permease [Bdellovibrio svalbardensis]MDG0816590.1 ABC transporter permease [Bdellovibrio svalbardensis]